MAEQTHKKQWEAYTPEQRNVWRKKEQAIDYSVVASKREGWGAWQLIYAKGSRMEEQREAFEAGQTPEERARSEAINVASKQEAAQRLEQARAADEARKQENVQVTPLNTPREEEPREEGDLAVGPSTTRQATPAEISLAEKISLGIASRRDYEAAGASFPESEDPFREIPGETEFQKERRISDEMARQRQLQLREQDSKYFEQIAINKREAELKQREEDAAYYARIEKLKRHQEILKRLNEEKYWLEIARAREEEEDKKRKEDEEYWEKIAEENRKRELEYRKEDDEYWDEINKRREEDKKEPTPTPTPSPEEPGEEVPITDPETGRRFMVPSSLLFGLLRTSGYYEEFLEEEGEE